MQISTETIRKLREKTGAGMMDCKRALEESGGNIDAAIEYLRKKGAAVAQKRAERSAKEGAIVTRIHENGKSGVIVEVNCETDFVARSEDFLHFAHAVAEAVELHAPADGADVLRLKTRSGKAIAELLNDLLAKVGEKVDVRRFARIESDNGVVSSYTHVGNKIGVLVELTGMPPGSGVGRDVAMQIAAMNPMVINREDLDKAIIEREMEIYRTQAKNEGKPAQVIEKIAAGRLEKFYQEVCLLEQTFIKDQGKSLREYVGESGHPGTPIYVRRFKRFHLGEETT